MILGLTYFFSTVKEGMDMLCVNYLVLLNVVSIKKQIINPFHPDDECIVFLTNGINVISSIDKVI